MSGTILSPNYPEKYTESSQAISMQCHWNIRVKPRHRVLLYFDSFEVEGNPEERGCPGATLRVWPWKRTDKTPIELCGEQLDHNKQILSETNFIQLSMQRWPRG